MIDKVEITVQGGNGGNGAVSFRREKFVPYGGPDGGDGGEGGNVIVKADQSTSDLMEFQRKRLLRAANGDSGKGKKMHGVNGKDLVMMVPVGTIIWEKADGKLEVIDDLRRPGQEALVVKGGRGGMGNTHYTAPTDQAPQIAQRGEQGEKKTIVLEMRLIADVGIIGYPNVGKSTLLGAASAARPKIANYPFTTLEPILGVVQVDDFRFTLAEIPGLVEGAHAGKGLGHDFLRHAMRTRIFIHLLDATLPSPVDEMDQVNNELCLFNASLGQKPQIAAVNKIDLPEAQTRREDIKKQFASRGIRVYFISAASGEGVDDLMKDAAAMLKTIDDSQPQETTLKVFRPQPRRPRVTVHKKGDVYVIDSPRFERMMTRPGASQNEAVWQIRRHLSRKGVDKIVEKAGVKPGDRVRCGDFEWEW